jgi:hypothetical protein
MIRLLAFGVLAVASLSGQSPELLRYPSAGIEVSKPSHWHLSTSQDLVASVKTMSFDRATEAMVTRGLQFLVVSMTKYKEPYPKLNPVVSVFVFPTVGPVAPSDFLKVMVNRIRPMMPDLNVTRGPAPVNFLGHDGVHAQYTGTLKTTYGAFPMVTDDWLITGSNRLIVVDVSVPWENNPALQEEFTGILNTIKIR